MCSFSFVANLKVIFLEIKNCGYLRPPSVSNKEQQAMDIEVEKCDKEKEVIGAIKEEGDPAVSHSIGSGTDTFQHKTN